MISHQPHPTPFAAAGRLLSAAVRLVRNRRALRDLDAAQLMDAGITPEALRAATDWRFWRRAAASVETAPKPALGTTQHHDVLAAMAAKAASAARADAPRVRVLRQAANSGSGRHASATLRSAA